MDNVSQCLKIFMLFIFEILFLGIDPDEVNRENDKNVCGNIELDLIFVFHSEDTVVDRVWSISKLLGII